MCRVIRECISGAACRCALAAFMWPVARCAPRSYSSAIVDTALGISAVDDCQALSRAARRRMRASLDHFYVRQLPSVNPPTGLHASIPEANRFLRRSGTHLPWYTSSVGVQGCARDLRVGDTNNTWVLPVYSPCVVCVLPVYLHPDRHKSCPIGVFCHFPF